ncbi:unnamed protein product [Rotaria sordida]|uniref:RNA helicase n=1 Tax=Rotaria sordida TaxID=392033 RepID=A0A818VD92_9BILA|nr:unnamed protein product [Rotaria sordida]CAF1031522.1 unnamed protein product [Rotaria sordida]CAF3565787.1 unnamed protein product [Rotaria sordida]CAF3709497.1 unnamed protein product [Rotaria sordida]
MIVCYRRLFSALIKNHNQAFLINLASYRINPIETNNQITVPHSMIKNIERQRAKKIYKKEQEEDPSGDRSQSPVIACKRSGFNHYPGRQYRHMTEKNVASGAWQHRLSKGDFFTIDHHFKNPSWTQSTVQTFEQLDCKPELIEMLKKANIQNPTSTQSRVIPELRKGRHMIVAAETGGGKTLAYLVPLIESLLHWKSSNRIIQVENAPFAIILAPTRELVAQIENMLQVFNQLNIRTRSLIGINTDKDPLNFTLGEVDIIISTPGILLRLLRQDEHFGIERRLIGSNLRHVIVDEADTLLDITFSPAVVEIIRRLEVDVQPINDLEHNASPAVQLIFVSATIPTTTEESLKELISADQIDKMLTPSVHRIMPHVPQKFYRIGNQQKLGLLLKLVKYDIEKKHSCLIFCNKTKTVKFLQQFFRDQRIEILVMHSQMTDTKRAKNLEQFRNGDNKIMCATDIISRGVDTYWVEHVIQFDFPHFMSDYIHRTGRVGRIGSKNPGKVSNFVSRPSEVTLAQKIEVTARINKKLSGVNNDIKTQLALHAQQREQKQEKLNDRQAREDLCKEVIRSAMV